MAIGLATEVPDGFRERRGVAGAQTGGGSVEQPALSAAKGRASRELRTAEEPGVTARSVSVWALAGAMEGWCREARGCELPEWGEPRRAGAAGSRSRRLRRPADAAAAGGLATFGPAPRSGPARRPAGQSPCARHAPAMRPPPVHPRPSIVVRLLDVALGLAVALFVVVVALAWRYQERLVWQPPGGGAGWTAGASGVREVRYAAADGQPLVGYLVAPPGPAGGDGPVLVAFHGNAETAAWGIGWAREVAARTGWRVILPEYRGYAGLPGAPSYEGSRLDARAAYDWVRDSLGVPPARIGIFGFSLGSAVAAELASDVGPAVLVLQAPFTSARDMARVATAWPVAAVWRAIARVHFDTRSRVARLDAPVWVAHGDADRIIPARMGRAVHAAARRPGELLLVPGAGHNDVADAGGAAYWAFLARALSVGR